MAESNYQKLIDLTKKISILSTISELLDWDTNVTMPPESIELRAKQEGVLAEVIHELSTKKEIGELIRAIELEQLTFEEKRNFDEIEYNYESSLRMPPDLVREKAETETKSESIWEEAKSKSDYPQFLPWLEKIISLQKRYAEADQPGEDQYTTLMTDYEDGLSREEISAHTRNAGGHCLQKRAS